MRAKSFSSSPAETSSTSDSAISRHHQQLLVKRRRRPWLIAAARAALQFLVQIGPRHLHTPATSAEQHAGHNRQRKGKSPALAVHFDRIELRQGHSSSALENQLQQSPQASSSPSAPPASESSKLSVSSWRSRRIRDAPSALRIATSLCRAMARESSRFATLAQAISSTSPTAAQHHQQRGARIAHHIVAQRESPPRQLDRWNPDIASPAVPATTFKSARAGWTANPGFIRPMALAQWLPRIPKLLLSISAGIHACDFHGKRKLAGITPTMVYFVRIQFDGPAHHPRVAGETARATARS